MWPAAWWLGERSLTFLDMPARSRAHMRDDVAALGARQGGALSRLQLIGIGVSDEEIGGHACARRWQLPVPGVVVTFTGPMPRETRWWVAVLHAGEDAALSHETAAEVYGLRQPRPVDSIHVLTSHSRRVVPPPGVVLHRTRLPQPERAVRIPALPPVTCVEDTVLDLVDQSRWQRQAVHWVMASCQAKLTTPAQLLSAMGRRRRIRHRALVKELCADVSEGAETPLELRYLRDVERAHGLPRGHRQTTSLLGGGMVFRDVEYVEYATVVELDGRRGHEGEENAFRDRRRDNRTVVGGRTTLRFGWTDMTSTPCEAAAQVAAVLQRHGWNGVPTRCSATCPLRVG